MIAPLASKCEREVSSVFSTQMLEDKFMRTVDKSILEHPAVIAAENGQGKRPRATTAE